MGRLASQITLSIIQSAFLLYGVLDGMISSTFLPRLVKNKNVSHSWGVGLTPFGTTLPVLDNFIVLL